MKKILSFCIATVATAILLPINMVGAAEQTPANNNQNYVESIDLINKPSDLTTDSDANGANQRSYTSVKIMYSSVPVYTIRNGAFVQTNIDAYLGNEFQSGATLTESQGTTYYQISDDTYIKGEDSENVSTSNVVIRQGILMVMPLYVQGEQTN